MINNGFISDWFQPQRGVRQGCPISPYLFIMAVELLAISIRENNNIRGIKILDREVKISQLADDTSCFVNDTGSVQEVLKTFECYSKCAGLKVNTQKTKAKYIGSLKDCKDFVFGLDWTSDNIFTLGVHISDDENKHYELNYRPRILSMKKCLQAWKCRYLSLKGTITVINTLAIAPLLYLVSTIYTPENVIKEVKDILVDFLWDSKPPKIAYDVVVKGIGEGGLKLVDFESKVMSLKFNWIKRMVGGTNNCNWKKGPEYIFKDKLDFHFSCNKPLTNYGIKFYEQVQKTWSLLQAVSELDSTYIRNQTIWNNKNIILSNQPFFWKHWHKCGIIKINDLLDDEGQFLSHSELSVKWKCNCNFLEVLQIRQCIPFEWKQILYKQSSFTIYDEIFVYIGKNKYTLSKTTSNMVYWNIVNQRKREATCKKKWTEEFPRFITADPCLWPNIFRLSFNVSRDTKIQSFQYKLIHRLTNCRKKLFDMKLISSPKCEFCDSIDTIRHFFLFCNSSDQFWNSFFLWWNRVSDIQIPPEFDSLQESILFGFQSKADVFLVLNFCVLLAKYYIYRQKMYYNNNVDFYDFLKELRYKLTIEKNICNDNKTPYLFTKYLFIYDEL